MKPAVSELLFWLSAVVFLSLVFLCSTLALGGDLDFSKLSSASWLDPKKVDVAETVSSKPLSIIQFWASWCKGCGENMEVLSGVARQKPELGFFSVSIDDTAAESLRYFKLRPDSEFISVLPTAIWDKEMIFTQSAKVSSVPYFLIANSKGEVLKGFHGHVSPSVKAEVLKLISLHGEDKNSSKEGKK